MALYNTKFRKLLLEKIISLSRTEHEEIFKIINRENIAISSNRNGVFFNLSSLSDQLIEEIDKFVTFCHYNKKDLDDYDKKINECKVNNVINILDNPENVINIEETTTESEKNDWEDLVSILPKKSQVKLQNFITNVQQDREKISKKSNNGFNNARKRYGKKIFVEFPRLEESELVLDVIV